MNAVGLITEYNPFHNGHKYHLDMAREVTGADFVVVVMSGNFVQRGTPAITDKYTRTKMALSQGADLVIELPVCFSTASAEYFSYGAISLLNSLGIVNSICFGSECGDLELLSSIADILTEEPKSFQSSIRSLVKAGNSYPVARMKAFLTYFNLTEDSSFAKVLSCSNNILGIEYLKALKRLNSNIKPFTITRKDSSYHDDSLGDSGIASATAIRLSYLQTDNLASLQTSVPSNVLSILSQAEKQSFPIFENDISDLLYLTLLQQDEIELSECLDVSRDFARRIKKLLPTYTNFLEFSLTLKTKQYTLTRIQRGLLHILLGIKKDFTQQQPAPYIRILGLRKEASFLINKKNSEALVPIITKVADAKNLLSDSAMTLLEQDIFATNLYNRMIYSKFGTIMPDEYRQGIILS